MQNDSYILESESLTSLQQVLKKISQKIGFTETEIKVILFLTVVFLTGYTYITFFKDKPGTEYKTFDYSEQDSMFWNAGEELNGRQNVEENNDIKKQILELKDIDLSGKNELPPLTEKSINLNTAGLTELIRLPGIGEKTAEKIINLRTERGGFRSLDELKDVKGIGDVKFNKIKNFLYIKQSIN